MYYGHHESSEKHEHDLNTEENKVLLSNYQCIDMVFKARSWNLFVFYVCQNIYHSRRSWVNIQKNILMDSHLHTLPMENSTKYHLPLSGVLSTLHIKIRFRRNCSMLVLDAIWIQIAAPINAMSVILPMNQRQTLETRNHAITRIYFPHVKPICIHSSW